jgi:hypothetical protein
LESLALSNPTSAAAEISQEIVSAAATGGVPTWFALLPAEVQTYFITQAAPAIATAANSAFSSAFAGSATSKASTPKTSTLATLPSLSSGSSSSVLPSDSTSTGDIIKTGISGGAKAGIAVGVVIGVAALALLVFIFWKRKGSRQSNFDATGDEVAAVNISKKQAIIGSHGRAKLPALEATTSALAPAEKYKYQASLNGIAELADKTPAAIINASPQISPSVHEAPMILERNNELPASEVPATAELPAANSDRTTNPPQEFPVPMGPSNKEFEPELAPSTSVISYGSRAGPDLGIGKPTVVELPKSAGPKPILSPISPELSNLEEEHKRLLERKKRLEEINQIDAQEEELRRRIESAKRSAE